MCPCGVLLTCFTIRKCIYCFGVLVDIYLSSSTTNQFCICVFPFRFLLNCLFVRLCVGLLCVCGYLNQSSVWMWLNFLRFCSCASIVSVCQRIGFHFAPFCVNPRLMGVLSVCLCPSTWGFCSFVHSLCTMSSKFRYFIVDVSCVCASVCVCIYFVRSCVNGWTIILVAFLFVWIVC